MNNKGRGSGLALILLLVVALLVAWLAMTQMGALNNAALPGTEQTTDQTDDEDKANDPVQKAQDAVDTLNEKMQP